MSRKRIIGQDKDYDGPLSKTTVENVVSKFMNIYNEEQSKPGKQISGFELNGGERMTKGGQTAWDGFKDWAAKNNMDAEYNTKQDISFMENTLRNKLKNKNK